MGKENVHGVQKLMDAIVFIGIQNLPFFGQQYKLLG